MDYEKLKNDFLKMGYVDERGLICLSSANITMNANDSILSYNVETIYQKHLPAYMILSICNDRLHISKSSSWGKLKKYFGALQLNKLTFVKSFNKEFDCGYEFIYELEYGTSILFYINKAYDVIDVVNEIINFKKVIPNKNNYGFTLDPQDWFDKKQDYLNELAINKELNQLAYYIVVYYVLRVFINEMIIGGFLYFFNNSYKLLYEFFDPYLKLINNSDIESLLNKAYELLSKYKLENLDLTSEDNLKIEQLNNEFFHYQPDFYDQINHYYIQCYKEFSHYGELMVKEMLEDNVYSKICDHLKPILEYELNNKNYITEAITVKEQYVVNLKREITFGQKEIEVEFWESADENNKLKKGYYCNSCQQKIAGPLDNSLVENKEPRINKLKRFGFIILCIILILVFGAIFGLGMYSWFSNPGDDFSITTMINFMVLGVLIVFIIFMVKYEKKNN